MKLSDFLDILKWRDSNMTDFRKRKIILYLFVAIILPISLSLICLFLMFHIGGNDEGLVFTKHHIDLGELNYNEEVTAKFPFKNTTSNTIKITKLQGDCRCTNISADKKVVLPGETGTIAVAFRSAHRRGPETHRIAVLTDAPEQEIIKLTLSAVIDPRIELIPRALSFGRVRVLEDAKPRMVSIISRFREPAKTISVSSSNPYIKATLLSKEPTHSREAGKLRVELCGKPPSKKLEGDIAVITRTEKGLINSSITVVAEILGEVQNASNLI